MDWGQNLTCRKKGYFLTLAEDEKEKLYTDGLSIFIYGKERAYSLGANNYILKPFEFDEFRKPLQTLIFIGC